MFINKRKNKVKIATLKKDETTLNKYVLNQDTIKLNIEYEYIITNGTMDVDKIINKSSRQRISSFEISKVERIEKYNPNLLQNVKKENLVFACNQDDPNAYLIVASHEDAKVNYIVFSPNEKLQEAIKKSLPKFIANSAFK